MASKGLLILEIGAMVISIIIPVYNGEAVIKQCMQCWAKQSLKSFELIFIDDGSDDNTKSILKSYQSLYSSKEFSIEIIPGGHEGVSNARNLGLEKAKGDIIGFCDVDDVVSPKMLEYVCKAFEETEVDLVCTYKKDLKKTTVDDYLKCDLQYQGHLCRSKKQFKWELLFDPNVFGSVWNKYMKREVLIEHRFNKALSMCEDTHFMYTLVNQDYDIKIFEITVPLYGYVQSEDSVTGNRKNLFDEQGNIKYCNAFFELLKETDDSPKEQRWIKAKIFDLVSSVCVNHEYMTEKHLQKLYLIGKKLQLDYVLCNGYSLKHRIKRIGLFLLLKKKQH